MSIARTFYKKLCKKFFDQQILSARAFLAQIAIQALFHRCKKVTPSIKCLPNEQVQKQNIPTKIDATEYSDTEYVSQRPGVPFYLDENTKNLQRRSCNEKMSEERTEIFRNTFINFGATNLKTADGVLRSPLELESQVMKSAHSNIRLLHQGAEELIETRTYLDYTSGMLSHLLGRCEREKVYEFCKHISGGRSQGNDMRSESFASDIPIGLIRLDKLNKGIVPINRILSRTIEVGCLAGHSDMTLGCSGAVLHEKSNIYKTQPYACNQVESYKVLRITVDFDDCIFCRVEKMDQSIRMVSNCLVKIPKSDVKADDYHILKHCKMKLPMENVNHHFTSRFHVAPGQTYKALESQKSEFGMVFVFNCTSCPICRCIIRTESFPHLVFAAFFSPNYHLVNTPKTLGSFSKRIYP